MKWRTCVSRPSIAAFRTSTNSERRSISCAAAAAALPKTSSRFGRRWKAGRKNEWVPACAGMTPASLVAVIGVREGAGLHCLHVRLKSAANPARALGHEVLHELRQFDFRWRDAEEVVHHHDLTVGGRAGAD